MLAFRGQRHKRDKEERLTPAQQINFLSAFEKKTASYAKCWVDGQICSMMMLHERARLLGNEKLTLDEKGALIDAVHQSVLDDAQRIDIRKRLGIAD